MHLRAGLPGPSAPVLGAGPGHTFLRCPVSWVVVLMDLSAPGPGGASGFDEIPEPAQVLPDLHVVEPHAAPAV